MSITLDIFRAWRNPAAFLREKLTFGAREDRALALAVGGAALLYVAQWPRLAREAFELAEQTKVDNIPADQVPGLDALLGINLFGFVFILPLVLYAVALLAHGVAKALRGRGSSYGSRLATFWAVFSAAPAFLFNGLVLGLVGPGPAATVVGILVLILLVYLWLGMLIGAHR